MTTDGTGDDNDAATAAAAAPPCKRQRMDMLIAKSMNLVEQQSERTQKGSARSNEGGARSIDQELAEDVSRSQRVRHALATKHTWTTSEDALLVKMVAEHRKDWANIAMHFPNRDRKRCRERFVNHLDAQLSKTAWSTNEDARLKQLHEQHGNKWSLIAQKMAGRSAEEVKNRILRRFVREGSGREVVAEQDKNGAVVAEKKSSPWSAAESAQLQALVKQHGPGNWWFLASQLPGRTDLQCLQHWYRVLDPVVVKGRGTWTAEEDAILRNQVATLGRKWSQIATLLPGRLGKQCRERYCNHLDPSIKDCQWSAHEDAILVQAQATNEEAHRWTLLSKKLPGRTENAIKNRWNKLLRQRHRNVLAGNDSIEHTDTNSQQHTNI